MKRTNSESNNFFLRNWFQFAIVILLLIVFVKRDVNIKFSLGNPNAIASKRQNKASQNTTASIAPIAKTKDAAQQQDKQFVPIAKGSMTLANPLDYFNKKEELNEKEVVVKKQYDESDYSPEELHHIRFIKRFATVAVREMELYGIPASIKLAQGIIASDAGKTELALEENNFFAVPCDGNWDGDKEYYSGKCYRKYKTAWMSMRDHSDYITAGSFKYLVKLGTTNYHK